MSYPRYVLVANTDSSSLSVFSVDSTTGRLRFRSVVATANWPVAIAVHPSGRFAYVANSAVANQVSNTVSVYRVGPDGTVIGVGAPVAAMSTPVSLAMAPNGRHLYVACSDPTTVNSGIEIFAINRRTGALARPVHAVTGTAVSALALNPAGSILCALNRNSSQISTYSINGRSGALSVAGPSVATDTYPNAVLVAPSGQFVYVGSTGAVSGSGTVVTYSLNPATGALAQVASVVAGEAWKLLVHPSGNFVYALVTDFLHVIVYSANLTTGVLTQASTTTLGPPVGTGIEYSSNFGLDPTGQYLYVTFFALGQSNTVTAYAINATNGSLSAVPGGVITSGGIWPGALAVIEGRTPVTYTPKFAYVTYGFTASGISAYAISATTGALTPLAGFPLAVGVGVGPMAADPSGRFLYVADENDNVVWAYTIDAGTGALTAVTGSPFAAGDNPLSIAADPSGQFVYVLNNEDNTVWSYTINSTSGALTVTGSPVATGTDPIQVTVDPSGRFVYVTSWPDNAISAYTINSSTGVLTAVTGSPFAGESYSGSGGFSTAGPSGLTVDPSGQFLYVAMLDALNIWTYAIDTSTGALTPTGTSVFAQDPNSITMDPSGQFAYVGAFDNVFAYTMNPGTGVLTAVAGSPFAPGTEPGNFGVAVDPSGQFAYVASRWYRNLAAYTIDPSSGALTATGSSAATGGIPDTVVIIGTI